MLTTELSCNPIALCRLVWGILNPCTRGSRSSSLFCCHPRLQSSRPTASGQGQKDICYLFAFREQKCVMMCLSTAMPLDLFYPHIYLFTYLFMLHFNSGEIGQYVAMWLYTSTFMRNSSQCLCACCFLTWHASALNRLSLTKLFFKTWLWCHLFFFPPRKLVL